MKNATNLFEIKKRKTNPRQREAGFPKFYFACQTCGAPIEPRPTGGFCNACNKPRELVLSAGEWHDQRRAYRLLTERGLDESQTTFA